MFEPIDYEGSPEEQYKVLLEQLRYLIQDEHNQITNLANASALLNQFLTNINWVGFYILEDSTLMLGPFQGLPACTRIPLGKGVCGTSAIQKQTILVDDVHEFPGHIACDAASNSEIVVPIFVDGQLFGVLDVDSPIKSRFTKVDQQYLEQFCEILAAGL